jgi:8-amino-7-oxononanoate synthase
MLDETISTRLQQWQQKELTRVRPVISQYEKNRITVNDKSAIQFASSDYLALSRHPLITEASTRALQQYGLGSGASAMVVGYSDYHQQLEEIAAKWLQVDQVILFSSGYLANIGVLQSLIARQDSIAADKLCHASLLTGIQLTRAKQHRYAHHDMAQLQKILMNEHAKFIVTESVFSMQGDIAPIETILALAKEYKAGVIIDDAHGVGVLGNHGRGIIEEFSITQQEFLA